MSRICKLSIRGIRNFDDDREGPNIQFSRPLTLILGPNGTGKTTIIECLRYALSGEFPPGSSQGKSFIHDPMLKKLAAISVRGNVKAEIADCRGDRLTISRTIEATRVNKKVTFKTLDSAISRINRRTGEKTQLTGTCAAVDIEVMSSMGVSKAILNYVLFCHQDDANWPFEAGKKLKERFDEIFDTTRYNKALDTLRKIIKDKQGDLKVLVVEQRSQLNVVEEVRSKEKKLKDFNVRRTETREKIDDLKTKLRPINQRLVELNEIEREYSKWLIEDEKKKMQYNLLCEQISSLKKEITELYSGTTEELSREIVSYQEILSDKSKQIAELELDLRETSAKDAKICAHMAENRVSIGTMRQQMHDQTLRVAKRNETLRDMNELWELNEKIGDEVSESEATELIRKFDHRLRELEQEIEAKRIEQDKEQEKLQSKLNTLRSERTTIESQLVNNRRELQNIRGEIRASCALLKKSGAMEEKLNDVDARLDAANKKVDEFNKTSEIDTLKRKIHDATIEEETNETKYNKVEKEINLLREQSSLQIKLESCHEELTEKEKEIEILREKHGDTLNMLFGKREFPMGGMMDTINEIQTVLNDRIKNLRKEIDTSQYEAMKLETSMKHKKEELEKKTKEIQRDKSKVSMHCGEYANYREVLLLNSKKVKDMEDKRGMYAYQGAAYKEYIKKLSEPECSCPLCHRGFNSCNEAEELVTELRSDMTGHPERLKNCEKELSSQRKKYDALLQLQPIVERIEHFEDIEMTKMRQDIEETSKRLAIARQKIKRLQESMNEPEKKLSHCKDMIGDMALWDRCSIEIEGINLSISDIQERLSDAGLKTEKTLQNAQKEYDNLQQLLKDARREIKNLQTKLDTRNEELRRAIECRTKLLEEQLRIHKEMQDIKQAKETLDALRSKETEIESSVENFKERLIVVGNNCEIAEKNLEHAKKNIRAIQDFDRQTIRERNKDYDKVNSIQLEVKKFLSRNIGEQLRRVEERLENAEKLAEKFKQEKITREKEIARIKQDIVSNDTRKRDLTDNLSLRSKETESNSLKLECDMLKEKLVGANYTSVSKERKMLMERRDVTERERNIAQGNEEELDRNIAQLKIELERGDYRRASSNYKDKCVELAICRLCIKDLQMYCKVLDIGMIEYHEERMNTINKSMKKLWDLIYTGTDTTSIQIRTEATNATTEKRRTFNYKLVQIKHGIEMDMKGRCSAGQKILASIILRLALAETFCDKCGVLALDEPTTNLDEENTKSLADALHSYVNRRSKVQKNFQLIVITHDDNFIPKLGQLSRNNSFYQLYRYESGLSGIKCVSLDGPSVITRDTEKDSSEDENNVDEGTKRGQQPSNDKVDRKRAKKKHVFE